MARLLLMEYALGAMGSVHSTSLNRALKLFLSMIPIASRDKPLPITVPHAVSRLSTEALLLPRIALS